MLSKSAKSILWPRYGAPEVAKSEKFFPPYYHHIVFLIHPLSQLRYPLTIFELQIWLLFDAFFCSTIYGLEVYWWWTCLFKIKWFVAHGENVDFQIDQRDNILIVLEVVYNQFCNPQCFGNSQQFSWQKKRIHRWIRRRKGSWIRYTYKMLFSKIQRNNLPASGLPRSFIHPLFLLFTVVLFRSLYFKQACSSSINFQSVNSWTKNCLEWKPN